MIFSASGEPSQSSHQITLLLNYLKSALDSSAADEILYGRAGYLFSLLFVKNHVQKELIEGVGLEQAMRKVFDAILKSGNKLLGSAQRYLVTSTHVQEGYSSRFVCLSVTDVSARVLISAMIFKLC